MERVDVLVVGGGPGGSSCARELRRRGVDVTVLDRQEFPRDKVCAGWITPPVLATLEIDPADYAKTGRVLQPIHGFAVSQRGEDGADADCGRVVSYGIRRCEFDQYLLARSGATLALGEALEALERDGDDWIANERVRARWLIGAGGHFCPVARALGARPGASEPKTVLAREIEFELTPDQQKQLAVSPERPALYFEPDLRGYGWVVRKGDWLNVGLGRQDPEGFPRRVEEFCAWLIARGLVPEDLPRRWRGHAYLLHAEAPRPLSAPGALLVGDAAGFAYARSGEGIRPAVETGILAGRALARALRANAGDARVGYERAVEGRLGPRRARAVSGVSGWLPAPARAWAAKRLLATAWLARRVVVERWFLHQEQAALAAE